MRLLAFRDDVAEQRHRGFVPGFALRELRLGHLEVAAQGRRARLHPQMVE